MLFSATFFCLFPPGFSYCIQFLLLFSLNLGAAKLPIFFLVFFCLVGCLGVGFFHNASNIWLFSGIQSTWINVIKEY